MLPWSQDHITQEDGIWVLQDGLSSAKRAQLADAFSLPMALCYQAQERGTFDLNLLPAALESGQLTQEQLLALRDEATTQMTEVSDTMLRQVAVEYMKEEYTALGHGPGSHGSVGICCCPAQRCWA